MGCITFVHVQKSMYLSIYTSFVIEGCEKKKKEERGEGYSFIGDVAHELTKAYPNISLNLTSLIFIIIRTNSKYNSGSSDLIC